jgi:hypothetical protein
VLVGQFIGRVVIRGPGVDQFRCPFRHLKRLTR